ncbi:MAG: Rieske (2Fe-2S) protein [Anaerolineales bacterium]
MSPKEMSRRDFIKITTAATGGVMGVVLGVPAVAYLIAPAMREGAKEDWVKIGNLNDMEIGKPFPFTFTRTQVNGWERTSSSFGGFVIRKSEAPDDLLILSSRCTHLACRVSWHDEAKAFICPCHDAQFGREGEVLNGPPPRPLDRYEEFQVDVDGNVSIFIKGG